MTRGESRMSWRAWPIVLCALAALSCDDDGGEATVVDAAPVDGAPLPADTGPGPDAMIDLDAAGAPDAAPDAAPADPPARPDELPTEGAADLPGVDDLSAAPAEGRARAGFVDDFAELITGPEATCRLGDLRLDNDRIAVCIQAETSFGQFTAAGGNLVDAVPIDRLDGDYLREIIHAPGLGETAVESIGIVRDGSDGGPAIVRTTGRAGGALLIQGLLAGAFVPPAIRVTTEYRLAPGSDAIEVLTWLIGDGASGSLRMVDMVYFGDMTRAFPNALSPGDQPEFLAGETPGLTYGWRAEGPIALFPLVGIELPVVATQSERFSVGVDDIYLVRRWLDVGADVESVRPAPEGGQPVELTGPDGLWLSIVDAEGVERTRAQLAGGVREVSLPAGRYTAEAINWPGGAYAEPFEVPAAQPVALTPPAPGELTVRIRDADGAPLAGRVELSGPGERLLYVVDDETVSLPVGEWQALTTHGWHFTLDRQPVVIAADAPAELDVVLTEVIPAEGVASGEFHQHASPSTDSEVPTRERVLTNLVEGVHFMAPSDHDIIFDYAGLVADMGLSDRIGTPLSGVEISPVFTHIGAYGVPYDAYAGAGGAPSLAVKDGAWRILDVPELVASARARGARLVQINHARASQGYFDHVGYDPEVPLADLPPDRFTADFDTMEINNRNDDMCRLLTDWMGLLNQGLVVTAVGNSDTHDAGRPAGYPRNYVPTAAADPVQVTDDEIVEAMLAGRVTIGGGAYMDFPEQPGPGDTVAPDGETLSVRVRLRTPPYARADRLIAYVNGVIAVDLALDEPSEAIVDHDAVVEVPVPGDAHVVFVALGDPSLEAIFPGRPVFAVANPIWVDRDGDGVEPVGPGPLVRLDLPWCN